MIKEGSARRDGEPAAVRTAGPRAALVRGTEAPRADQLIAAYVTHSRPRPRVVRINTGVSNPTWTPVRSGVGIAAQLLPKF